MFDFPTDKLTAQEIIRACVEHDYPDSSDMFCTLTSARESLNLWKSGPEWKEVSAAIELLGMGPACELYVETFTEFLDSEYVE